MDIILEEEAWIRLTNVIIEDLGLNLMSASALDIHGIHKYIAD